MSPAEDFWLQPGIARSWALSSRAAEERASLSPAISQKFSVK